MSETDLPDEGTGNGEALDVTSGALALENLLTDDPATDTVKADDSQADQDKADEADDDLVLDDETDAEADASPETEYKAGKFASDDAKVILEDGTAISVAELKRNNLFQRDYTKKTQELSQAKTEFEQSQRQFAEYAQQLAKQREIIEALAPQIVPQEPPIQMLDSDPIGYMHAKAEYDQRMAQLNQLFQSRAYEQQHMTAQQQAEYQQFLQNEQKQMLAAIPQLQDPKQFEQFTKEAVEYGTQYGYTPQEIASINDHRAIKVLRDAMAYRKALAKREAGKQPAPVAKAQPPRIQQKQRMAPQSEASQRIKQAQAMFQKNSGIDSAARLIETLL